MVNRTLGQMLRCLISRNPRAWENLLPHIEFAYNRVVNYTTSYTPFEVVYGFNPLTPVDLLPIPLLDEVLCKDGFEKVSFIKDLHHPIKLQIERKVGKYAEHANKGHRALILEPGDWVWLHLRKDRFPTQRNSKLMPRGDGPFQVLKRINDNAYLLDLPNTYLGSNSFNISDLTPFSVGLPNSWTNTLQPGKHDEDLGEGTPTDPAQPLWRKTRSMTQDLGSGQDSPTMNSTPIIPQRITRSRAQTLGVEHQLVSLFVI